MLVNSLNKIFFERLTKISGYIFASRIKRSFTITGLLHLGTLSGLIIYLLLQCLLFFHILGLQTQHKVEMDKRDGKFGPQPMAVPPVQQMSRLDQPYPPTVGYPPTGYPPAGYPPAGYPPAGYQR